MSRTNQTEIIEKACRSLLRMFESGEMPEAVTRTFIEAGKYEKPSNKWSLGNKLLMLAAETGDARGYDQWQKVGRNVRKGAKSFYIFGYSTGSLREKMKQPARRRRKLSSPGSMSFRSSGTRILRAKNCRK